MITGEENTTSHPDPETIVKAPKGALASIVSHSILAIGISFFPILLIALQGCSKPLYINWYNIPEPKSINKVHRKSDNRHLLVLNNSDTEINFEKLAVNGEDILKEAHLKAKKLAPGEYWLIPFNRINLTECKFPSSVEVKAKEWCVSVVGFPTAPSQIPADLASQKCNFFGKKEGKKPTSKPQSKTDHKALNSRSSNSYQVGNFAANKTC